MASTINLGSTIAAVQPMLKYRPLAFPSLGSPVYEPALTIANKVLLTILGPPFRWRWNRLPAPVTFTCNPGQTTPTDYPIDFLGQASIQFVARTSGVAQYLILGPLYPWMQPGSVVNVTCSDASFNQVANSVTGVQNNSGGPISIGMANAGSDVGIKSVTGTISSFGPAPYETTTFGSIETAAVQDISANARTPNQWKQIPNILSGLAIASETGLPHSIAAQYDNGGGLVTFRVMPSPDQAYPIMLDIQQKPNIFAANAIPNPLNQLWAPIPDEYSHLYTWGFEALSLLMADDARFGAVNQKFVSALLSTHQGLTENEKNIFLATWQAVTGAPIVLADKLQQGVQARGI